MEAEAACIICNWANNVLWPYFGLGALGAGAAAAAVAGGFSSGGFGTVGDRIVDAVYDGINTLGDGTIGGLPVRHYTDRDGNPYWPGISAIPDDGVVYARDYPRNIIEAFGDRPRLPIDNENPLPVDPNDGHLILGTPYNQRWVTSAGGTQG